MLFMISERTLVSSPAPVAPGLLDIATPPGLGRLTDWGISLGEAAPVLRGVLALAPTDGLVTAHLSARDGERGSAVLRLGVGDAVQDIAGCAVHRDRASGVGLRRASFSVPVPRGSLFQLDDEATAGAPVLAARWTPFSPGLHTLGDLLPIPLDQPLQATTNGILVATLTARENGDRGALFAASTPWPVALDQAESLRAATYAERSPRVWVARGSLTLPVARGEHFKVQTGSLAGRPEIRAWWRPVLG